MTSAALVQPLAAPANAAPAAAPVAAVATPDVSAKANYCSKPKKPYGVHVWACAYYRIKGKKNWTRCNGGGLTLDRASRSTSSAR